MGGCQNYGPFLGTLNIRCRIIIGTQKGTIILTTTHIDPFKDPFKEPFKEPFKGAAPGLESKVQGLGFRAEGRFRV